MSNINVIINASDILAAVRAGKAPEAKATTTVMEDVKAAKDSTLKLGKAGLGYCAIVVANQTDLWATGMMESLAAVREERKLLLDLISKGATASEARKGLKLAGELKTAALKTV